MLNPFSRRRWPRSDILMHENEHARTHVRALAHWHSLEMLEVATVFTATSLWIQDRFTEGLRTLWFCLYDMLGETWVGRVEEPNIKLATGILVFSNSVWYTPLLLWTLWMCRPVAQRALDEIWRNRRWTYTTLRRLVQENATGIMWRRRGAEDASGLAFACQGGLCNFLQG